MQLQRWADFRPVRSACRVRSRLAIGCRGLKVHRGQFIGETTKIKLPIWSMVAGTFLFRDPQNSRPAASMFAPRQRSDGMWPVDFTPLPQAILVDFEGGHGTYLANRKQVIDQAEVDMLILGDDGKLFVRRSQVDLNDPERKKREETWRKWLEMVQADTDKFRNDAAQNQNPSGAPAGSDRTRPTGRRRQSRRLIRPLETVPSRPARLCALRAARSFAARRLDPRLRMEQKSVWTPGRN